MGLLDCFGPHNKHAFEITVSKGSQEIIGRVKIRLTSDCLTHYVDVTSYHNSTSVKCILALVRYPNTYREGNSKNCPL